MIPDNRTLMGVVSNLAPQILQAELPCVVLLVLAGGQPALTSFYMVSASDPGRRWLPREPLPRLGRRSASHPFKLCALAVQVVLPMLIKGGMMENPFDPDNWGVVMEQFRMMTKEFMSLLGM